MKTVSGAANNRGQSLRHVSNVEFILVLGVTHESILVERILKNFSGNVFSAMPGMTQMWITVVKRWSGLESGCVNKKGMASLQVLLYMTFKYEEAQCPILISMKKLHRSNSTNLKVSLNIMYSW